VKLIWMRRHLVVRVGRVNLIADPAGGEFRLLIVHRLDRLDRMSVVNC
jgi:hypothetical protein